MSMTRSDSDYFLVHRTHWGNVGSLMKVSNVAVVTMDSVAWGE